MQIKPNNPNFDSGTNIGGWSTIAGDFIDDGQTPLLDVIYEKLGAK